MLSLKARTPLMPGRHLAARPGRSRKEVGSSAPTWEISLKSNMASKNNAREYEAGNLGRMLSRAMRESELRIYIHHQTKNLCSTQKLFPRSLWKGRRPNAVISTVARLIVLNSKNMNMYLIEKEFQLFPRLEAQLTFLSLEISKSKIRSRKIQFKNLLSLFIHLILV